LGRAVHRALESWEGGERIVIFGTGGLSHQLDGERAGFINKDYDRFCLDALGADPEALTRHSALDIVELAGSQGIEILNWIAARGALGETVGEFSRNYHVPISNTASASMLLECPAALARIAGTQKMAEST
jgi:protocatechuate 4,5-dioxygenase beta chain